MMKRKTIALLFLMITLLCGMTGCADFAFNPIGRWEYIEQRVYVDNVLQKEDADAPVIHTALVFQKSGTGRLDVGDKHLNTHFTYDYDDNDVTITFDNNSTPVVYHLSENKNEMTAVLDEGEIQNNNGKNSRYRVETIFRKT